MSTAGQVFVSLVTVASLTFMLRLVRRRQLRAKYSFLWLSVGLLLALLATWPQALDRVSKWVGVAYPPNVLFLLAITLLLLIVIHFSWELSRLEERTRNLAEDLALLRAEAPAPAEGAEPAAQAAQDSSGGPVRRA